MVTGGSGGTASSSSAVGGSSANAAGTGSVGSTSGGVNFYGSRCRSPARFESAETRYEARARESYTLASVVHRELYREERGRRGDRTYRRSRSPHTSQSHNVSPQKLTSPAARPPHSPSGSGSRSRSSSSDSASSTSSSGSGRSVNNLTMHNLKNLLC